MRQMCLEMIYKLAQEEERIFFIGSDLGVGVLKEFKEKIPTRFFMEGVGEANIVGIAAGLAMEGKIPYVNTIATFLTRRCFEQVVLDVCLHNVNVRLIGSGGGLVYAPLGPTHQAIEDLAILRAIPNITIIAPADANEMRRLMPQTVNYSGPIYIRLAKGRDPIVSRDDLPFEIGKAILVRSGQDGLVVTTGICLGLALEASSVLSRKGIDISVLHMHTIKPLDREALVRCAEDVPVILAVEEHTVVGGLGGAIAETLAETDFASPKRFRRIGIADVFTEEYGSQDSLMERYGVSSARIVSVFEKLLRA